MSGFSKVPLVASHSGLELDNIRPLNLSRVYDKLNQLYDEPQSKSEYFPGI